MSKESFQINTFQIQQMIGYISEREERAAVAYPYKALNIFFMKTRFE